MFATTTLSKNGQVVIPAAIRKELPKKARFAIQKQGRTITLHHIDEELDKKLTEALQRADDDIRKGSVLEADTNMNTTDIDALLCDSSSQKNSKKPTRKSNTKRPEKQ